MVLAAADLWQGARFSQGGMTGLSFAIIAWGLLGSLRKEFEDLKKSLEDSGVLKDQT